MWATAWGSEQLLEQQVRLEALQADQQATHRLWIVNQPFELVTKVNEFVVTVNVAGGGIAAQAEAVRHGVARALLEVSTDLRTPLKRAGFLTRDARKVERKKPGQPGARRRFQYSKR